MKKLLVLAIYYFSASFAVADTFNNVVATNYITSNNKLTVYGLSKFYGNLDLTASNLLQVNKIDVSFVDAIDGVFYNSLKVGQTANNDLITLRNGYIQATLGISAGSSVIAGSYLSAGSYVQSIGAAYLGSYAGGYALTVNNTDGGVILKKAQGDISMGIYGN